MCLGHKVYKEKIGNILILLASNIRPLYHTKLLKLLFLIDERAVRETGVPVTWLDYQAWKLGPVSPEMYDLRYINNAYQDYIDIVKEDQGTRIVPVQHFDDSSLSDYEIKLVSDIARQHRSTSGKDLVALTHERNGLWEQTIKKYDITFDDNVGVSPYYLDLTAEIKGDKEKLIQYHEVRSMLEFEASLLD